MTDNVSQYPVDDVIRTIRGQKVILDTDLARIYGVEVRRLNEQVKRNRNRFPADFMFQLTVSETMNLRSQTAISSLQPVDNKETTTNWSQSATLTQGDAMRSQSATASTYGGRRYRPFAFTEHGAIMAATVLNSTKAVEMSVFVVRAFVKMREQLLATTTLAKRLAEVEKVLLTHDSALRDLYQKLRPLLLPPPEPTRKRIGFGVKERRAQYRVASRMRRGGR
jgi:hypothetical protein